FHSISPHVGSGVVTLTVVHPNAGRRWTYLRYVNGGDVAFDVDPALIVYGAYSLQWLCPDPYWFGNLVSTPFQIADPVALFPGPPFHINPTDTTDTAQVSNLGGVPAWWTAIIHGPFTQAEVGIGDQTVVITDAATSND